MQRKLARIHMRGNLFWLCAFLFLWFMAFLPIILRALTR